MKISLRRNVNFCPLVLRPHLITRYHHQSTETNNFISIRNLKLSSPMSRGWIILSLLRWEHLLPIQPRVVNETFRKLVFLRTLSLSSFVILVSLEPKEEVPDHLQKAAWNVVFNTAKMTRGSVGELFGHHELFLHVC